MRSVVKHRRTWLLVGLCVVLSFAPAPGPLGADKGGESSKCEGTKKQRKQKMEKREISDEQLERALKGYKQTLSDARERMKETVVRRLERDYERSRQSGTPFVFDILVISGGGAKGAFGAGFLQGWGEVPPGPMARPEFDAVTGVSTGALIAPFAFIGSPGSYSTVAEFYANPGKNWVRSRGLIKFLPSHVSMYNNCHLQDAIRSGFDLSLAKQVAEAAEADRLLLIGATNLDAGSGRVFDVGAEAHEAVATGNLDRLHSILLASSAIPGAFPPIEIDDMLYADGGATCNLFLMSFPRDDGPAARFLARNPGAALPKVRIWILVNQELLPDPAVTQPRWLDISGRALGTLTSTSQLYAMDLMKALVDQLRSGRGVDAELRYVAIPPGGSKKPKGVKKDDMFDKEYMVELEALGRRMGADPSSWQEEIPSAYGLERTWLDTN